MKAYKRIKMRMRKQRWWRYDDHHRFEGDSIFNQTMWCVELIDRIRKEKIDKSLLSFLDRQLTALYNNISDSFGVLTEEEALIADSYRKNYFERCPFLKDFDELLYGLQCDLHYYSDRWAWGRLHVFGRYILELEQRNAEL